MFKKYILDPILSLFRKSKDVVENVVEDNPLLANAALRIVTAKVIKNYSSGAVVAAKTIIDVVTKAEEVVDKSEGALVVDLGDKLDEYVAGLNLTPDEELAALLITSALKEELNAQIEIDILDKEAVVTVSKALSTIKETAKAYEGSAAK